MARILWNRTVTWFTGRNGLFKCIGVSVWLTHGGDIGITPITSKGNEGRCDITIERESIPALIRTLQAAVADDNN